MLSQNAGEPTFWVAVDARGPPRASCQTQVLNSKLYVPDSDISFVRYPNDKPQRKRGRVLQSDWQQFALYSFRGESCYLKP